MPPGLKTGAMSLKTGAMGQTTGAMIPKIGARSDIMVLSVMTVGIDLTGARVQKFCDWFRNPGQWC